MMNRHDPKGAAFTRLGRYDVNETACQLWWSGSGVRTRLDCARLEAELRVPEQDHTPWLMVSADGAPVARIPLKAGTHRYDLLGGMEKGVAHEIELTRDTQPTEGDGGPLELLALYTDGVPEAPATRPRLIEFLGDSLTVGEGTLGPVDAMEWRMVWICNRFAFPALAAEALGADKRVVALGGWGAHVSYDGNTDHTIGHIYDQLCAVVPGGDAPYDFAAQRPADAVVINLGTNDGSCLDKLEGPDRGAGMEALSRSAEALLEQVRERNPGAKIVWAYGLCGDVVAEPLRRAVKRRAAAGDGNVTYLALDDCAGNLGSRSHPGRAAHERAAEQLVQILKESE